MSVAQGSDLALRSELSSITDFKLKEGKTVGHLVSLKVGSKELTPDFHVLNPLSPKHDGKIDCAGLLTYIQWNKTPGGLVLLEGRICESGYGILQGALDNVEEEAKISFKFNFYKYHAKGYYKAFHTDDKEIEGYISVQGTSNVDDEAASDYQLVRNHPFTLALKGSDVKDQDLHVAYGPDQKFVLKFGLKCGA